MSSRSVSRVLIRRERLASRTFAHRKLNTLLDSFVISVGDAGTSSFPLHLPKHVFVLTPLSLPPSYRNAQMLFSSLRHIPCYTSLPFSSSSNTTISPIPTIPELQALLEAAWEKGHDPAGAAHFKGRVAETKKWIGTTEIYTVLTWMGIRWIHCH